MASVQYLFSLTDMYSRELKDTQYLYAKYTQFRILCAIVIQKYWRGYSARKKYRYIYIAIVTIQSYTRGWLVRKRREQYIKQHKEDMRIAYLNKMATRIQSLFRGYLVRKLLRDRLPKMLIAERKRILEISTTMANEIKNKLLEVKRQKKEKEMEDFKQMVIFILFKCHHMLRTQSTEGVYSRRGSKELSIIEQLMKALPLKDYMTELRRVYKKSKLHGENEDKDKSYLFQDRHYRDYEDLMREARINEPREEKKRLHDFINFNRFNFFHKAKEIYERELSCIQRYATPLTSFRDVNKKKHISAKDFILKPGVDLTDKVEPYHIDFWMKIFCKIHNLD